MHVITFGAHCIVQDNLLSSGSLITFAKILHLQKATVMGSRDQGVGHCGAMFTDHSQTPVACLALWSVLGIRQEQGHSIKDLCPHGTSFQLDLSKVNNESLGLSAHHATGKIKQEKGGAGVGVWMVLVLGWSGGASRRM